MAEVPIIPRRVIFGNPDKASPSLSHNGEHLAFLAPRDGVLNVWVAPRENPEEARPVTNDRHRGIQFFAWTHTDRHIIYIQDKNGDENWRIHIVDVLTEEIRDLTPFDNVQARVLAMSHLQPEGIIVGLNKRSPQWHDVYRLDIMTGELELVEENDRFVSFAFDDRYNMIFAFQMMQDGSLNIMKPSDSGEWDLWDSVQSEDQLTTGYIDIDKQGKTVLLRDSRDRNTSALVKCNLSDKKKTLLAEHPKADLSDIFIPPTEKHPQAVAFTYARKEWKILDSDVEEDFSYLLDFTKGELSVVGGTLDNNFWIISDKIDDGPVHYYVFDRKKRSAKFLFTNRRDLEGQPLVKMHSTVIKSRDGLDLVVYYSLPLSSDTSDNGIPDKPLPMVLIPHGGPWWRDHWGYDAFHQWLANRGYAVVYVNFRSSTGFGKAFTNAGDQEWGGKIIEDQADTVKWAIEKGIADPERVGVMGGSFGGYSTLAGLTFFPELYACGVDIVGPSNLETFINSIPDYWKPMFEMLAKRIGDPRTEEGRNLLKRHSPITYVDRIRAPLLIGQGANDPRVKKSESDQIVEVMNERGIPVAYVLYPDEGHGFARPENRLSFFAITEAFLARCLGGSYEPIGEDLKNSSLQVLSGADEVPGLKKALK